MKRLFGGYLFPEKWEELGPRFKALDGYPQLDIGFFTSLDERRENLLGSDAPPTEIQDFMSISTSAMSYCSAMAIVIGGHKNQAGMNMDLAIAKKSAELSQTAKSDAALGRALGVDLEIIGMKWEIEDWAVALGYVDRIFKSLQKDAENWRARFFGAHSDKKLTPGVNAPYTGGDDGMGSGLPPHIGGR